MKQKNYYNETNAQLRQDAIDARKNGMSYGHYMAMVHENKIKRNDVKKMLEQSKNKGKE